MIDILPELREKISSIPKEYTHAGSSHSAHAESSSRHSDFHSEEEESGFFSDHYPLGLFIFKIRVTGPSGIRISTWNQTDFQTHFLRF